MLKLQKSLAEAESEWGRTGRFMQEKDTFAKAAETGTTPKSVKNVTEGPSIDLPDVAGMSRREVNVISRMVKMSGGEPRNIFAVSRGARVIKETGILRKGLEVFANSLLSGLATPTALMMNAVESTFRASSKMLAGAFTANKALFREGADILYANDRYLVDNIKAASAAFKAGRSIINPQDTHIAIEGAIGDAVRIPSRALLFADEFTRVTNYRSFIRARSLRYWRERGAEGAALYGNVERDLRSAFDERTGMATIPEALNYAEGPTMSAALGKETIGGKLSDFLNNTVEARFVAPFVKTSINVFRLTWDRTPALNMFSKRARNILLGGEGKEAAADLWTQTGLAGSIYVYGYLKAKAGEVTGRGPADPQLRKLWMQDHKPYSIKVGGEWISYRRGDPLFAPLGIVADLSQIMEEVSHLGHGEADAGDLATAFVASLAASFSNKTYMQGVTQFFDAWSGGSKDAMKRWLYGLGTGFVPQAVSLANSDTYLREVESFKDAVMAKIPGLSEKLPARYDLFGEPISRQPSLQVFPSREAPHRAWQPISCLLAEDSPRSHGQQRTGAWISPIVTASIIRKGSPLRAYAGTPAHASAREAASQGSPHGSREDRQVEARKRRLRTVPRWTALATRLAHHRRLSAAGLRTGAPRVPRTERRSPHRTAREDGIAPEGTGGR
jgi:hypothetical protein